MSSAAEVRRLRPEPARLRRLHVFVGDSDEGIGVVTEPAFRRQGPSAASAAAPWEETISRARGPSWTTSPDNASSLAVAHKLGFTQSRHDRLFVVGRTPPEA